ncbi:MAG: hypothetical protein ACKOAD_01090 [Gammaproteobacteria bacterium]
MKKKLYKNRGKLIGVFFALIAAVLLPLFLNDVVGQALGASSQLTASGFAVFDTILLISGYKIGDWLQKSACCSADAGLVDLSRTARLTVQTDQMDSPSPASPSLQDFRQSVAYQDSDTEEAMSASDYLQAAIGAQGMGLFTNTHYRAFDDEIRNLNLNSPRVMVPDAFKIQHALLQRTQQTHLATVTEGTEEHLEHSDSEEHRPFPRRKSSDPIQIPTPRHKTPRSKGDVKVVFSYQNPDPVPVFRVGSPSP